MRDAGDIHGEAITLDTLGYAQHHLGEHVQAIDYFRRALELVALAGDRYNEAEIHLHLADAMAATGDPATAHHRQRAIEILDELGHPRA
jgi:hypothetical protein